MHRSARLLCLVLLSVSSLAQTVQQHDVRGRPGLVETYNRFKDQSMIQTRRQVTQGLSAKANFFNEKNELTMEIWAGVIYPTQKPVSVDVVFFAIDPTPETTAGRMFADTKDGRIQLSAKDELIAVVEGERINLGRSTRQFELSVPGGLDDAEYFAIPFEVFRKMAASKNLEMAIASTQLRLTRKQQERWQSLVDEIVLRREAAQ